MVQPNPNYFVKTPRLFIRPLATDDAADIHLMRSNPLVMKYTSMGPSDDIEVTKSWIQDCHDRDNCWNFAIELNAIDDEIPTGPKVIGLIGAVRAPEIGYMLNRDYWGKGYATEALVAFLPMFFEHFCGMYQEMFDYAEAHTDPELIASQRVLEKAGFTLYERREKDFENREGEVRDTLIYRIDRPITEESFVE